MLPLGAVHKLCDPQKPLDMHSELSWSHNSCMVPYLCPCSSIADCHLPPCSAQEVEWYLWLSLSFSQQQLCHHWQMRSLYLQLGNSFSALSTLLSSFFTSRDRWHVEARVYQFIIHVQQEPGVANNSTVPLIVQYVSHNTKMFSKLSVLVFHTIYDLLLLAFLH